MSTFVISHSHTPVNIFAIFNDRPFKFYTRLNREEYKRFIYMTAHNWAWSGNVTKFVILHPLFATVEVRAFKFYAELTRENYNNIYVQEPVNSRAVEFCVELTSVMKSLDHYPTPGRGTGIVFGRFVSFFVSLSATLREKDWTDLHEIFREDVE